MMQTQLLLLLLPWLTLLMPLLLINLSRLLLLLLLLEHPLTFLHPPHLFHLLLVLLLHVRLLLLFLQLLLLLLLLLLRLAFSMLPLGTLWRLLWVVVLLLLLLLLLLILLQLHPCGLLQFQRKLALQPLDAELHPLAHSLYECRPLWNAAPFSHNSCKSNSQLTHLLIHVYTTRGIVNIPCDSSSFSNSARNTTDHHPQKFSHCLVGTECDNSGNHVSFQARIKFSTSIADAMIQ